MTEAQLCAVEFLETILCLSMCLQWHPGGHETMCELSRHLLNYSFETFATPVVSEMPLLLSAVLNVLFIHPSMGATVDSLSSIAIVDPRLGVALLLTIMFYSNIFIRNYINRHDMLLKFFEMLPSLASHSAMIPLVVQTILPMLNKDAKVSLTGYEYSLRMIYPFCTSAEKSKIVFLFWNWWLA
ncbi:RST1 protein [Spatholobus suberectus]|nr:RST1 protein [Spatholobus suberectus]